MSYIYSTNPRTGEAHITEKITLCTHCGENEAMGLELCDPATGHNPDLCERCDSLYFQPCIFCGEYDHTDNLIHTKEGYIHPECEKDKQ